MDGDTPDHIAELNELLQKLHSGLVTRAELERHALLNKDQLAVLDRSLRQQMEALEKYLGLFERYLNERIEKAKMELEQTVSDKIDAKFQYELADAVAEENRRVRKGLGEWLRKNARILAALAAAVGSLIAIYFTAKGLNEPAGVAGDAAKTFGRISN